jgi:hypothetical protein
MMNIQRYLLAVIAMFIYIYAFEFVVHGKLLAHLYSQTPTAWRDYHEMLTHVPFNMMIMALLSIWLTFVFTRLFKKGGWKNGIEFGLYIGVLSGIQAAGAYYYLPISLTLTGAWFVAYVIESIIGGLIIGAIYQHNNTH